MNIIYIIFFILLLSVTIAYFLKKSPSCDSGNSCKPDNYTAPCDSGNSCKPNNYTAPCDSGNSCKPNNYTAPCNSGNSCKPNNYTAPCESGSSCKPNNYINPLYASPTVAEFVSNYSYNKGLLSSDGVTILWQYDTTNRTFDNLIYKRVVPVDENDLTDLDSGFYMNSNTNNVERLTNPSYSDGYYNWIILSTKLDINNVKALITKNSDGSYNCTLRYGVLYNGIILAKSPVPTTSPTTPP